MRTKSFTNTTNSIIIAYQNIGTKSIKSIYYSDQQPRSFAVSFIDQHPDYRVTYALVETYNGQEYACVLNNGASIVYVFPPNYNITIE